MKLLTRLLTRRSLSAAAASTAAHRPRLLHTSPAPFLLHTRSILAPIGRSKPSPFSPGPWSLLGGQRRSMFIQTQSTPNPMSLMFYPGKPVMEVGSSDFPNARTSMTSPLAKSLFGIDAIMDFYSSGEPLFVDSNAADSKDTVIHEDDSEIVAMIKELLETRIRPAVKDDGGDIEFCGFDEDTGIVKLRMQGACSGCPSSAVTLKSGIENMLMHYVPEVQGVEQELDGDEEESPLAGHMD